jgi:hypothetical protein
MFTPTTEKDGKEVFGEQLHVERLDKVSGNLEKVLEVRNGVFELIKHLLTFARSMILT